MKNIMKAGKDNHESAKSSVAAAGGMKAIGGNGGGDASENRKHQR